MANILLLLKQIEGPTIEQGWIRTDMGVSVYNKSSFSIKYHYGGSLPITGTICELRPFLHLLSLSQVQEGSIAVMAATGKQIFQDPVVATAYNSYLVQFSVRVLPRNRGDENEDEGLVQHIWEEKEGTIVVSFNTSRASKNGRGLYLSQMSLYNIERTEHVQTRPITHYIRISPLLMGDVVLYEDVPRQDIENGKQIMTENGLFVCTLGHLTTQPQTVRDPFFVKWIKKEFAPTTSYMSAETYVKRDCYDASTMDDHLKELSPIVEQLTEHTIIAPGDGLGIIKRLAPTSISGTVSSGEGVASTYDRARGVKNPVLLLSYVWCLMTEDERQYVSDLPIPIIVYDTHCSKFDKRSARIWTRGIELQCPTDDTSYKKILFSENFLRGEYLFEPDTIGSSYEQYYRQMRPTAKKGETKLFLTIDSTIASEQQGYCVLSGKMMSAKSVVKPSLRDFALALCTRTIYKGTYAWLSGVHTDTGNKHFMSIDPGLRTYYRDGRIEYVLFRDEEKKYIQAWHEIGVPDYYSKHKMDEWIDVFPHDVMHTCYNKEEKKWLVYEEGKKSEYDVWDHVVMKYSKTTNRTMRASMYVWSRYANYAGDPEVTTLRQACDKQGSEPNDKQGTGLLTEVVTKIRSNPDDSGVQQQQQNVQVQVKKKRNKKRK